MHLIYKLKSYILALDTPMKTLAINFDFDKEAILRIALHKKSEIDFTTFDNSNESSRISLFNKYDYLFVNLDFTDKNEISSLNSIRSYNDNLTIIIFITNSSKVDIFQLLNSRINGIIDLSEDFNELNLSLTQLFKFNYVLSGSVISQIFKSYINLNSHDLSERELQVLRHLGLGKTYAEIADELFISKETSKSHIKNIYRKLDVHRKSKAIKFAKENKLI